ncbi:MAG: ribosome biogenesis GTPase Der [Acidimicrobiales bacterium]
MVGRPNVGKSTLVNRILGRREAIVEEHPGVTRDRRTVPTDWAGRRFALVDTGGWQARGVGAEAELDAQVSRQAERAVAEADVVVMVVDTGVGPTEEDSQVARLLRRSGRPVVLAANKVDNVTREPDAWAFTTLGLGDPLPISAIHGRGSGDLLDAVVAALPAEGSSIVEEEPEAPAVPQVAIAGRPNSGKSTLMNRLAGDECSIVSDIPGTTRDSVDTVVQTPAGPWRFIDTAGMRRRGNHAEGAEYYSMVRALQAIDRADAAVLMIDATQGVTNQDQRLAERIDAAGCALVIVLNKWEVVDAEQREEVKRQVGDRLFFLGYAPVLRASAKTGKGIHRILPALTEALEAYHRRVPTSALNSVIGQAQAAHPAKGARVLYATQGGIDPPTFVFFVDHALPPAYLRYLERRIRESFEFGPTPMKFRVKTRSD